MMRYVFIPMIFLLTAIALLLAGCAHDNYAQNGDAQLMAKTLYTCKVDAARGAIVHNGGLAGAAAGALIGIASVEIDNPNRRVEQCMAEHGYIGTSN